jgi:L-iditol 2-dehydrogenase
VATDLLQQRLDAAGSIGATQSYNANDWNAPSSTRGSLELLDLDVVFEAAGTAEAVDDCFLSVKPGGKVILIGIPAEDTTHFTASVARRKGLTIKLVRRMGREYPRAIELVKSKSIDLTSLISHHFPLSQVNVAFDVAERREGIKVIIDIQEQQ